MNEMNEKEIRECFILIQLNNNYVGHKLAPLLAYHLVQNTNVTSWIIYEKLRKFSIAEATYCERLRWRTFFGSQTKTQNENLKLDLGSSIPPGTDWLEYQLENAQSTGNNLCPRFEQTWLLTDNESSTKD